MRFPDADRTKRQGNRFVVNDVPMNLAQAVVTEQIPKPDVRIEKYLHFGSASHSIPSMGSTRSPTGPRNVGFNAPKAPFRLRGDAAWTTASGSPFLRISMGSPVWRTFSRSRR